MDEKEFLGKIKDLVLLYDNKAQVILFGSRARGDYKEDSDWDILVLTDKKLIPDEKHAMIDSIYDIELKYLQAVSTLVVDKQTWSNWEIKPLYRNVKREGIAI